MSQALPISTADVAPPPAATGIIPRLSVMMFLQYAIQGAWLPITFLYLHKYRGFENTAVASIMVWGAIGAIAAPFFAGQLADRYMNAERFMALAHAIGAVVVWVLAEATNFYALAGLAFLYGLMYTPTLATGNAIAFAHLPDRDRDFGKVRMWGTIGWICVGIGIGQWLLFKVGPTDKAAQVAGMRDAFRVSTVLGLLQAAYVLTLPKTPPKPGKTNYAPREALAEIGRSRALLAIFLISVPIAAAHQFFFVRTSEFLQELDLNAPLANKVFGVGGAGIMTIGQLSELVCLGLMPFVIKRVPRKALLCVGLLAYFARFMVFAYLPYKEALLPALALHGIVFGCFFFICFMVVDELTTTDVRASAQNLFNLVVFGVGVIVGNLMAGWLDKWTSVGGHTNWQAYYAVPGWLTLACLVALLVFFPSRLARPAARGALDGR